MEAKILKVQEMLRAAAVDGWLLYDFRRMNALACTFLEIPAAVMLTRRFFYWIPVQGEPVRIVSAIEEGCLSHLPGRQISYRTWQDLERAVSQVLSGNKRIFMEYSPGNAVPYVSKVDAGTLEMVRGNGVEVLSSADLLQTFSCIWGKEKLDAHRFAAAVLCEAVEQAWRLISAALREELPLSEWDVQQHILTLFKAKGCITEGDPIVAVNAHSADPHYTPSRECCSQIRKGDFILIDLWCKQDKPHAVYADICRVGVAAAAPDQVQQRIFSLVKQARDAGTELVRLRFAEKKPLRGWEVDQVCRDVIAQAGYGDFFIHRTGHNIDEQDHGSGAHLDNYETQDRRLLLPGTCFSIEPGIYLPGEFGVRLEYDVFVHSDGQIEINGGVQEEIAALLP